MFVSQKLKEHCSLYQKLYLLYTHFISNLKVQNKKFSTHLILLAPSLQRDTKPCIGITVSLPDIRWRYVIHFRKALRNLHTLLVCVQNTSII